MSNKQVKVLVAGSVCGNFKQLCTRINNVNAKSGPFDMLLIPGQVIGDNVETWLSLREGTYKLDVPTYILGATEAAHSKYYSHISDGVVTDNVTFLGRRGVYTTTSGLSVAYISGVFGDDVSNKPHCFTESDINVLQAQAGVMNGIDILLTNQWPVQVMKFVKKPDGFTEPPGVRLLAHLVNVIKPRYHFTAGPYYERLPYRNHKILHERATYCTRFISLGCVANKTKCKWLYAFNVVPMKHISDEDLRKQPTETTENPYVEIEKEKEKEEDKNQYFYNASVGDKRKMPPPKQAGPERKKESCWFCLKSPSVEKHLVISVGGSMYLALAKGALRNDHVMIVPTNHIKCQQFLDDSQQQDVEKFKRALRTLNRTNKKSTTVFFERSLSTSHMQIQAIPVPRYSVNDIKDVFYTFSDKYNLEIQEVRAGEDWKEVVPPGSDYFLTEFENEDKLVFLCSQKVRFPLQFGREVLASEELLNMPRRVSWKECRVSKEQEEHDVKQYRKVFTDFDPFNADSDSD